MCWTSPLSACNSVILVDHDTQILSEADWLIEMGPEVAQEVETAHAGDGDGGSGTDTEQPRSEPSPAPSVKTKVTVPLGLAASLLCQV